MDLPSERLLGDSTCRSRLFGLLLLLRYLQKLVLLLLLSCSLLRALRLLVSELLLLDLRHLARSRIVPCRKTAEQTSTIFRRTSDHRPSLHRRIRLTDLA